MSNINNEEKPEKMANKEDKRTDKRRIGDIGEDIACAFLSKNGYSIGERNYLRKYGEIDIVAVKEGNVYFFEVKTVKMRVTHETDTRQSKHRPEDNVSEYKLRSLRKVVQTYLIEKHLSENNWKFGVITVELNFTTRRARVNVLNDLVL